jgi:hypothetical protein
MNQAGRTRRVCGYDGAMDDEQQREIHEAVNAALDGLAAHLGGTSDQGGPVENATQIKGRGDLGILLTDVNDLVLGRVWVAFGGAIAAPSSAVAADGDIEVQGDGEVEVQAEICSEVVEPPVPLEAWAEGR